jgi:hypothetical protein
MSHPTYDFAGKVALVTRTMHAHGIAVDAVLLEPAS